MNRHGKLVAVVLHLAVGAAVVGAFSSTLIREGGSIPRRSYARTQQDNHQRHSHNRMSWNSNQEQYNSNYDHNNHSYGDARNRLEDAIKRRQLQQQVAEQDQNNSLESHPNNHNMEPVIPVQDDQGIYQIKTKEQHA